MSVLSATRSVERQRFFDGERLFAADVQGIEAFNREMRWLHNQSLHQPGIGNGFAATGLKGDRDVVVGPGYGIDDLGREIVLTTSRTISVPPVAGDADGKAQRFALTITYPDDKDLEEVELREGVCDARGAVRLREEPIFCWVELAESGVPTSNQAQAAILSGRSLVIAEIAVRECRLDKDVILSRRRNARLSCQPFIACGHEEYPDWDDWDPWASHIDTNKAAAFAPLAYVLGGLQATIDTSAAGFLTTPCYFARIEGERMISAGDYKLVVNGLISIVDATPTSFTAQVILIGFLITPPEQQPDTKPLEGEPSHVSRYEQPQYLASKGLNWGQVLNTWSVVWMGVEG